MVFTRKSFGILALLIFAGIGLSMAYKTGLDAFKINPREIDFSIVLIALAASFAQEVIGGFLSLVSLYAFGINTKFFKLLAIVTSATSANSLFPVPAGIPARIWLQNALLKIPVSTSVSAISLELASGYGVLSIFAMIGSIYFGKEYFDITALNVMACVAFLILTAAIIYRKKISSALVKLLSIKPAFYATVLTILINVTIIGLATLRLYLILLALNFHVKDLAALTFALSIARIAGVISFIPMGLGSRDITLTGLMILSGVPISIATYASIIDRALSMAPYIFISLAGIPFLNKICAEKG